MSEAGERILEGAREALTIAKGEQPAASITVKGHKYVPAGWLPIDVAPKDGSRIILFTMWPGDTILLEPFDEIQIGYWDSGNLTNDVWHREPGWSVEKIGTATHWMPLPPPPSDTGR